MDMIDAFSVAYPLDILVAGNYPREQVATKELLSDLGYHPDTAESGVEVLRMTMVRKFDVILVDIRMPGLEQVLKAPAAQPGPRPILIALTSITTPDLRETCLKSMADSCISRPVKPTELLLQLKACSVLAGKCRIR